MNFKLKMYTMKATAVVTTVLAVSFAITACDKEAVKEAATSATTISDDEISVLQEDAQVSDIFDDIDNEIDDVVNANSKLKSATSDSTTTDAVGKDTSALSGRTVVWTINKDSSRSAVITYVNFQNPKAKNERVKNGKVKIVVSGKRADNTFKKVVTFENFTINDNKIEGTRTVEKTGTLVYKITVTDGKVTFTDCTYITCTSSRYRSMSEGASTPYNIWDDAFTFDGSSSGLTKKSKNYTKTIVIPVKVYTSYLYPVSGSFTLTIDNSVYTLDYGDGTKDDSATVSFNNISKKISLRK